MRSVISIIASALLACSALVTAPSHAQANVSSYYMYQDATANGCTARFMHRQTYDGGIAGNAIAGFGAWVKITDTCGSGYNDTSDFGDMGYCQIGPFNDAARCSVRGLVYRQWYMHANCTRELLSQIDGATAFGSPGAACVGSPIY